ncbi:hypothetical protein BDR22DRAFT_968951 [Usnea florida]
MVFYLVAELRPRHVSFQRAMRSLIGVAASILRCCFSVSQEQGPVELWKYQEVERLKKIAIAQKQEAEQKTGRREDEETPMKHHQCVSQGKPCANALRVQHLNNGMGSASLWMTPAVRGEHQRRTIVDTINMSNISWMTEDEKAEYALRDKAEGVAIQASIVAWSEGKSDEETRRLQAVDI